MQGMWAAFAHAEFKVHDATRPPPELEFGGYKWQAYLAADSNDTATLNLVAPGSVDGDIAMVNNFKQGDCEFWAQQNDH